jgi:hypothetical protein
VELSRREVVKYSSLGLLGAAFLGKEVQDRFEMSEEVTRRLVSDREYALQQIEELENSYREGVSGREGSGEFLELASPFVGNPNRFDDNAREGFVPDTESLLEDRSPERAFRAYVENGADMPLTSTQVSLLLDQELDLDLVYLDQGRDAAGLLSNGVETVEAEVGRVLPESYEFSVGSRVVEPDSEVEDVLRSISEERKQGVKELNEECGYDEGSTLPVYVYDARELDRLSALAGLDFSEMWAGSGSSDGSILALPSAVLGISEDEFYSTLVHEIGHSVFELPHSTVRDDVMTYNTEADNPTGFTSSEPLIHSYINSCIEIREEERDGERGVYFSQRPETIPRGEAVDNFLAGLDSYLTDMIEEFDLDVDRFDEVGYREEGGVDVALYRDYDGTGVDMRITADGHIRSIQASAG